MKKDPIFISILILVFLKLIPFGSLAIYPFSLLATWIHEMGHGLAAIATGGKFFELKIYYDSTGQALTNNGYGFLGRSLVLSSGYLFTAVSGFFLLRLRLNNSFVKNSLRLLVALILISMLVWGSGFETYLLLTALSAVLFGLAQLKAFQVQIYSFMALVVALDSIKSITYLYSSNLQVGGVSSGHSDATMLCGGG